MPAQSTRELSRSAVADAIREAILQGEFVPGQRLVEAEICESLNASRGTVRLALTDLVHEGMVEHIPNRGARVRTVGLEEALQIAEVRSLIERLIVARAAERITDEDIATLRKLEEKLKQCAEQGDSIGFADVSHEAFELYVRVGDHPVAEEVLMRLRARNSRHRFRLTYRPDRARVSLPFWLDIIDAICQRDPEAAKVACERRTENVKENMRVLAEERKPLGVR